VCLQTQIIKISILEYNFIYKLSFKERKNIERLNLKLFYDQSLVKNDLIIWQPQIKGRTSWG